MATTDAHTLKDSETEERRNFDLCERDPLARKPSTRERCFEVDSGTMLTQHLFSWLGHQRSGELLPQTVETRSDTVPITHGKL